MTPRSPALTVVSCIVERADRCILICLPKTETDVRPNWEFPAGIKQRNESHEAATRRICCERLDLRIDIHTGQPPIVAEYHGQPATYRFFLAWIDSGDAQPVDYAETRWIRRGQLCEYDFDPAFQPVIDWYTDPSTP